MKRTLLQRGAIIAACAAAFVFAACGDDPEFDARTDTVYSLETPSVTAKAYPGVNVVSWKPVTGAQGYNIFIYEEGVYKNARLSVSDNFYSDTNLVNSKTYTYYVEAVSKSDPAATSAREVFVKNSRGEASVKAIVPPVGTKSLELPAYEGGYDGTNVKTVSESDQWVVKPSNIKVEKIDNGHVYVSFPMKAYLTYQIKYYNNNLPHDANVNNGNFVVTYSLSDVSYNKTIYDITANNVTGYVSFPILSAGKYQIAVVASAYGSNRYNINNNEIIVPNYETSDEVLSDPFTVEKLELDDDTDDAVADYILIDNKFVENANKTVRVSFTPAMKDHEPVPTTWYKVYRCVKGEYDNTELSVTVKKSTDIATNTSNDVVTKYYIDDTTVTDVTKDYIYTIVVADGNKYGASASAELTHETKKNIGTISISSTPATGTDKKVTWTVTVSDTAMSEDIELSAKSLIVQDNRESKADVLAQEIIESGTVQTLAVKTGTSPLSKSYETETSVPTITGNDATVYLLVQATSKSNGFTTTNVIGKATVNK